ncbi:hypothetical protein [Rubellimicrobium roseum]|uniref:VPLPA-CTERM sorting domain-containing protein n=1 Tax=Rubellimicrobium roseum TaxID=687525 RepID=A0A5C4NBJ1_9RHOB|nr:hypothetical protein [Rubellimicrobium roseum]TNC71402.1 hypothetical protein FHG71_11650 [Rubellimicrobium roseum]
MSLRPSLASLALASFMGLVAASASALTCSQWAANHSVADVTGKVTSSIACEVGSGVNDSANLANADRMFGFDDWQVLSRDNTDGGLGTPDEVAVPISMAIAGTAQSGTVSLASNIWTRYSNLFLVVKGGGRNSNITAFVAYLLTPMTTSWAYATPYLNGRNMAQDISHFTVYGRVTPPTSPATPTPMPTGTGTTGGGTFAGTTGETADRDQGVPSDGPWFGGSGGWSGDPGEEPTPAPAAVPVPSGGLLLVSALAGLVIRRRQRA